MKLGLFSKKLRNMIKQREGTLEVTFLQQNGKDLMTYYVQ
jgi:hypothetical protein